MNPPDAKTSNPQATLISRIFVRPRQQTGLVICWMAVVAGCIWLFVTSRGPDATIDIDSGQYDPFSYTVDLNEASRAELASIPGIGLRTASSIVQWRTENGKFESVEALVQVDGISSKTVDAIRPFLSPIRFKNINHDAQADQSVLSNFHEEPQQENGE